MKVLPDTTVMICIKRLAMAAVCVFTMFSALAGVPAFAQSVTLDKALDTCVSDLSIKLPAGTRIACPRINAGSPELADYITGKLTARLIRDTRFVVINRDTKAVDTELAYQLRGSVSDEAASSITAQLGAEVVIAGSLQKAGAANPPAYRLDIRAIQVERNQLLAQWSAELSGSTEWTRLDTMKIGLIFEGGLSESDKRAVLQGVQKGIQTSRVPLVLAASVKEAEALALEQQFAGSFVISVDYEERNSLVVGTMSIALTKNGILLCSSALYYVTETTVKRFVQRCADRIAADKAFWLMVDKANG